MSLLSTPVEYVHQGPDSLQGQAHHLGAPPCQGRDSADPETHMEGIQQTAQSKHVESWNHRMS